MKFSSYFYKILEKNPNLRHVKCDFCNSEDFQILFKTCDFLFNKVPGEFLIVRCLKCNLVFTYPRLIKKELERYYSKIVSYDNRPVNLLQKNRFSLIQRKDILTDFFNYPLLKKKKLRKLIQFPNFLRIRRKWKKMQFVPTYVKNGKILDIGCAYGGYLYQLKKLGWTVKGIELSKDAVDYAVNILKLDVINQSIEDFQSKYLYDIIYMLNVLEHVESPKKILKKCYSLLKPSGKLVLSVPDFSGIEVRIYKKYAYTLQVPYHLYHFTPNTIKNYLIKTNFKKIKIIHQISTRDLVAPLDFLQSNKSRSALIKIVMLIVTQKLIRNTIIKLIESILAYLGKTSRMTIIAKK